MSKSSNPLAEVRQLLRDIKKTKSPPLTKKRVKDRIEYLETNHSSVLNAPPANIIKNMYVSLEQIRLLGQLHELYWLLNKPLPDYPMLHTDEAVQP